MIVRGRKPGTPSVSKRPPVRGLRPPAAFAPDPEPSDPGPPPDVLAGHPDEPQPPPGISDRRRPTLGVLAYCWPCRERRVFRRPAPGVPRRCSVCDREQGADAPTACAACHGPLPNNPEHQDAPLGRLLYCTWRCLVLRRIDPEARAIADLMGWTRV